MQCQKQEVAASAIERNQPEPVVPQCSGTPGLQMPRNPLSGTRPSIEPKFATYATELAITSASRQCVTAATTFGRSDPQQPIVLLTGRQFDIQTGGSRSARYDRLDPRSPRFDPAHPKPIKLTGSSIRFLQSEVNAWIRSRIEASRRFTKQGDEK